MSSKTYRYVHVDVFTTTPFEGNPLAVFPEAEGLDTATMQRIARELNLSETTFVFPPADPRHAAHVRIFTPGSELPFAGHPTIGTAFVLLSEGRASPDGFVLEEGVGPVAIRTARDDAGALQLWFVSPPVRFGARLERDAVARSLGLEAGDLHPAAEPELATTGPTFLMVALARQADVDRAAFEQRMLAGEAAMSAAGVYIFAPLAKAAGEPWKAYARLFAPAQGIIEDPATGSATSPLAAYMIRHGLMPAEDGLRLLSEQGTRMGRRSLLHVLVHVENGEPWFEVGGSAVHVAEGKLTLGGA